LNLREYATLVPLVILAFWIGIYPKPFFALIEKPVQKIVEQVNPNFYQSEHAKLPPAEFHAAAAETEIARPNEHPRLSTRFSAISGATAPSSFRRSNSSSSDWVSW